MWERELSCSATLIGTALHHGFFDAQYRMATLLHDSNPTAPQYFNLQSAKFRVLYLHSTDTAPVEQVRASRQQVTRTVRVKIVLLIRYLRLPQAVPPPTGRNLSSVHRRKVHSYLAQMTWGKRAND